jgi:UDP-N-acetyl-D-glucosamine dehydrogenase
VATEINTAMPAHVVGLITDALNARRLAVNGARVLVLGVAYKPNVADLRESPALDVLALLADKGAQIYYHDPFIPALDLGDVHMASSELTDSLLTAMDAIVIITPHAGYDWARIVHGASLVIDTRNATGALGEGVATVVKL